MSKLNFVASNQKDNGGMWYIFLWVKCEFLRLSIISCSSNSPISNGRLIALTSPILDISLWVLLELLQWEGKEEKEEEEMEETGKKKQNPSLSLKKSYTISIFHPHLLSSSCNFAFPFVIGASWKIC